MTYIEFFDRDAIENLCSCCIRTPDRVVFLGRKNDKLKKWCERYQEIFSERGAIIEFIGIATPQNSLSLIVEILETQLDTYGWEDCVFDLTGGSELYLTAVGVVFERYRALGRNLQLHKFNIINNEIIDVDEDGTTIWQGAAPKLRVEEMLRAFGGDVIYDNGEGFYTYIWELTDEFKADIDAMWQICSRNPAKWNSFLSFISVVESCGTLSADRMTTTAPGSIVNYRLRSFEQNFSKEEFIDFIKALFEAGVLKYSSANADSFVISYKDEQVKRCLTHAGMLLEVMIYKAACEAVDRNGTPVYHDVLNGVHIDWNSDLDETYTTNEIDLIMMHGLLPVFVSCKNGKCSQDELLKLDAVARHFGGKNVRKALIISEIDETSAASISLLQRAHEMKITPLFNISKLSVDALNEKIKKLWSS